MVYKIEETCMHVTIISHNTTVTQSNFYYMFCFIVQARSQFNDELCQINNART